MSGLPAGWISVPVQQLLGRTTTIDPGKSPMTRFELWSVPSFSEGRPDTPLGSDIRSAKQVVQAGDVLLCKIVPHINRVWIVTAGEGLPQIASGEWIVLRGHGCEPDYLRYCLSAPAFREAFLQTVSGVGGSLMRARPSAVASIEVPLAPLAEQQRVVTKLDAATVGTARARADLDRIPHLVERFQKASVEKLIVESASRAGSTRAGDLFQWASGKFLPKSMQQPGPFPVFGGNGINGRHNEATTSASTLVVGRVGAQCGNVHLTGEPAWITDNAIYAKHISPDVDLQFALYVFRSANLIQSAAGTGQPYVNQDALNEVRFPTLSLQEQQLSASRIAKAFAEIERLGAEAVSARRLVDRLDQAVLAKAFRGELVQQDPADDPASALLDRIRAERAGAPKAKRGWKSREAT